MLKQPVGELERGALHGGVVVAAHCDHGTLLRVPPLHLPPGVEFLFLCLKGFLPLQKENWKMSATVWLGGSDVLIKAFL